ncbi:hypothetical protein O6H91_07G058000 [Diphasiastrum complanatum]|uniref:Uncharacterized protein n=1 Tax=Diphasiastrum complanatum TaxID=34168 RepID=A0ACC2D5W8_DIPCM|nr:hypothetical protein O6H91_07G058000 [Diphasiastrum complanatum]
MPKKKKSRKQPAVQAITSVEEWQAKLAQASANNMLVLVNFVASWCDPCKTMRSLYSQLSRKHGDIMFLIVDVDQLSDVAKEWDVSIMPTFIFIKDEEKIESLVGADREGLRDMVARHSMSL